MYPPTITAKKNHDAVQSVIVQYTVHLAFYTGYWAMFLQWSKSPGKTGQPSRMTMIGRLFRAF